MFILSELRDLVRIPPKAFHRATAEAVTTQLHKKYANKVVPDLGLAMCVWDLSAVGDAMLKPGDGATYVRCDFRMVVFKPFVGEVLTGWIAGASAEGLQVRLGFFDHVFVPAEYLFEGCEWVELQAVWVWRPDEESELFLDVKEQVRFRVEKEEFVRVKPGTEEDEERESPYRILASCQTDGMGCVSWWE